MPPRDGDEPPYWVLISVLFSSIPLEREVAWALYDAACDLVAAEQEEAALHTESVSGTVRRTGGHVVMGTLGGPTFEAAISTPARADAQVRFFVTRQGIEHRERSQPRPPRSSMN